MNSSPELDNLMKQLSKDIDKELAKVGIKIQREILKSFNKRFDGDLQEVQKIFLDILKMQNSQQFGHINQQIQNSISNSFGNNIIGSMLGSIAQNKNLNSSVSSGKQSLFRKTINQRMVNLGRVITGSQARNG